jgi:maltooligosyltrehalose synthase
VLELPQGNWCDKFSGESFSDEIAVEKLFKNFPVALLVKGE